MASKEELIEQLNILITDALNKQNTAAKVRTVIESVINSSYNTTDDSDTFMPKADYAYSAIATPTGAAPTVTIDCNNAVIVSKTLSITSGSTGNVTLALSNVVNGLTATLHITNNDSVSRSVLLPEDSAHIDFSGNDKTIALAAGKSVVMGVTYTGSKYLWSLNIEE